ncbi:MAG: hypothetical protein IIC13_08685 [SAR324 cluster bacterium]|nr:hypothetical protein [SAR324 cluster bacterium]
MDFNTGVRSSGVRFQKVSEPASFSSRENSSVFAGMSKIPFELAVAQPDFSLAFLQFFHGDVAHLRFLWLRVQFRPGTPHGRRTSTTSADGKQAARRGEFCESRRNRGQHNVNEINYKSSGFFKRAFNGLIVSLP